MFPSASLSSWVVARLMAPLMKAAAPLALPAFAVSPRDQPVSPATSPPAALSPGQPTVSSPGFRSALVGHAYSCRGGSALFGRAGVLGIY